MEVLEGEDWEFARFSGPLPSKKALNQTWATDVTIAQP